MPTPTVSAPPDALRTSGTHDEPGATPFSITVCWEANSDACCFAFPDSEVAAKSEQLAQRLHSELVRSDWGERLQQVGNGVSRHDTFRIAMAACPKGCSHPQSADMGLIYACDPYIETGDCIACGKCVRACASEALHPSKQADGRVLPTLDMKGCKRCGRCVSVCPTKAIVCERRGWRVLLGGKLGGHPGLAHELDGLYSDADVADLLHNVLAAYTKNDAEKKNFGMPVDLLDFKGD